MLAAAFGVPYLLNSDLIDMQALKKSAVSAASSVAPGGSGAASPTHQAGAEPTVSPAAQAAWEQAQQAPGRTLIDLAEILRFDVDPAWVVHRFPRVSTGLSDTGTEGYRVPLVTGTANDDVAGALTYFFNEQRVVERITFYGTTGDPRRFVDTVSRLHGLKSVEAQSPGVFAYESSSWGQPKNQLHVRPAPIARAEFSRSKFQVELVLKP
jgi:hypothetical protein